MTGEVVENVEAIKVLAARGHSRYETAEQLNLCYEYIVRLARQHGIEFCKPAKLYGHVKEIQEFAAQGFTRKEIADLLNLDYVVVVRLVSDCDIKIKHGNLRAGPSVRSRQMAALYQSGKTLQEIGVQYGISRERVRQIIKAHHNLRASDGGNHKRGKDRRVRFEAKRNDRSLTRWGCNWEQYASLRGKTTRAFHAQRQNAAQRGIGWELNLWQWWSIWQQSGKWSQRGRGQGYVMCRTGDIGPYALGNVFIATARENSSDQIRKKSGLPIGVRKNKRCAGYAAVRVIRGKKIRLGSHSTPELAHAAYLSAEAS